MLEHFVVTLVPNNRSRTAWVRKLVSKSFVTDHIREENKTLNYRGLTELKSDPAYLIDTFGQAADEYTSAYQQVDGKNLEHNQSTEKGGIKC